MVGFTCIGPLAAVRLELMTVTAHAGHWLASVAHALPVIVLMGWMGVVKLKDNRARKRAIPTDAAPMGMRCVTHADACLDPGAPAPIG